MFPNIKQSILLIVALSLLKTLIVIALVYIGLRWQAGDPFAYFLVVTISTAILLIYSMKQMNLSISMLCHAGMNRVLQLISVVFVPIIFLTFGLQIASDVIMTLQNSIFGINPEVVFFNNIYSTGIFGVICICLVAPIAEELVFRGVILRGLLSRLRSTHAILLSSMLFAIFHFNADQTFFVLFIGCFLGWLYVKSYSLYPSIIAHICFNSWSYILGGIEVSDVESTYLPVEWQMLGFAALFGSMFILSRIFNKKVKIIE
ncbi:MAG: CPBP family intramembrane metalloprotease [Saccharospirillaceae bacterium]|nr:CPBP family intramembrane metalloprotease [Pseudomonadales bacterium]NRB79823.1 CPBP family intramembrane metalloprotease [Saccharospirillaceae bacterium]